MKKPKFSVIIPARNEEELIGKAITSIQKQTFQNFEIIVSNDGSTDKTQEIVEGLMNKDKRIRILNRPKGHSAAFARNRGAETAKGEILVFLDADTYLDNNCFEEVNKRKDKADAFSFPCYPKKTSKINNILNAFYNPIILEGETISNKNSEYRPMFFCIKKEAYSKIKGYDEEIFYYEDEDFSEKFYNEGFKSINLNTTAQYFELPSSFNEFARQCRWIGKGTNTIKDKEKKRRHKLTWFGKSLFLLSPLFFLAEPKWVLGVFIFTFLLSYIALTLRNRNPVLSFIAMPFLYLKTFLVSFNIIKFWK